MIDYNILADYIIMQSNQKGYPICNLKLQKTLFYCQAYHIAMYGEDLIDFKFEAWKHGAVLRPVYYRYNSYGYHNINIFDENRFFEIKNQLSDYLIRFLDKILTKLGPMTADELRSKNHNEDPWKLARKGYGPNEICTNEIDEQIIYNYYSIQLKQERVKTMNTKKVLLNPTKLRSAKQRLAQRPITLIDASNKEDYLKTVYTDYSTNEENIWRVMNACK